jgi:hypothetical protein
LSEIKSHIEVELGSERNFGLVLAGFFFIVALWPLLENQPLRLWAFAVVAVLVALAFFAPKVLSVPNRLWFKLGMALGAVVAPLVMILVYFTSVMPIGLAIRLSGKDLLRQKMDRNAKSYWIHRDQPVGSMKDQF